MTIVTTGGFTVTDQNDIVALTFSQDSVLIQTDSNGLGGDFSSASVTFKVMLGNTDDTVNWTFSVTPAPGVTGNLVGSTYSITDLSVDISYVDVSASAFGYQTLSKRFTVSKVKRGVDGPSLSIVANSSTFTFIDGVASPASQIIALTAVRQNVSGQVLWYASNGAALTTDLNQMKLLGYGSGIYDTGVGDTCYVDLATIGAAEQIFITAVAGSNSATYCISKSHKTTAEAGATRNVYRGSWSLTTIYSPGDIVLDGGSSWLCLVQHVAASGNRPPSFPATSNATWTQHASQGRRGTIQAAVATAGSVWSDSEADAAIVAAGGLQSLQGDVVTLYNTSIGFSQTRVRGASTWEALAGFFGGDVLVDGTLSATKLKANEIDASKLVIADFTNLVPSPNFEETVSWTGAAGARTFLTAPSPDWEASKIVQITDMTGTQRVVTSKGWPVSAGEIFVVSAQSQVISGTGSMNWQIQFSTTDDFSAILSFVIGTPNSTTSLVKSTSTITAPAQARFARIRLQKNTGVTDGYFGAPKVRRAASVDLMVDGSLTASKVNTSDFAAAGLSVFDGVLKSSDFVAGNTGWQITQAGAAEFNSLVVRTGNLETDAVSKLNETLLSGVSAFATNGTDYVSIGTYSFTPVGGGTLISLWLTCRVLQKMTTGSFAQFDIRVLWRGVAVLERIGIFSQTGNDTLIRFTVGAAERFNPAGSTLGTLDVQLRGTNGSEVAMDAIRLLIGEFKR